MKIPQITRNFGRYENNFNSTRYILEDATKLKPADPFMVCALCFVLFRLCCLSNISSYLVHFLCSFSERDCWIPRGKQLMSLSLCQISYIIINLYICRERRSMHGGPIGKPNQEIKNTEHRKK